jgi:hypothetical protein
MSVLVVSPLVIMDNVAMIIPVRIFIWMFFHFHEYILENKINRSYDNSFLLAYYSCTEGDIITFTYMLTLYLS